MGTPSISNNTEQVVTFMGCLLGGEANNGSHDGVAYVISNNGVALSNTYVGSRICEQIKIYIKVSPCLLAKHKNIKHGFGRHTAEEDVQ